MNVTCPNCATIYRVDPAKVPETGVRARCAVCNAVFAVRREGDQAAPPKVEAGRPAPTAAPKPEQPRPEPPKAAPAPAPRPEPFKVEPPALPKAEPTRPVPPAAAPRPPVQVPSIAPAPASPAPTKPTPTTPGLAPRPAAPARPAATTPSAPAAASAAPSSRVAAPAAPAAPEVSKAPPTGTATPQPSPAFRPAGPAGARPTNPFLSQDPTLKAKRLARALISDMVVYHPGKRQEGLRDGNLKELFDDEIKKSFEEYADQVGRELAESTGYFREALNEILAGGRQIF